MRLTSSLAAVLSLALAGPALGQRDNAPPAPRTPSATTPPTRVADESPPLTDAQLDQVAAIVERSVARAMQAERDARASLRQDQPPTPSAAYPSSQGFAQAPPATYVASYVQPVNYGYIPPQPAPTYVNVQVPAGPIHRHMASLGAKLTTLGQPRIRSMALAPTAVPTTTATVQLQTVLPQVQQVQAPLAAASKAAPVAASPQNYGLAPR